MSSLFHSGESWQQINKQEFIHHLHSLPSRDPVPTQLHSLSSLPELLLCVASLEGYRYSIPNSGLILGRDSSCDIVVDDPTLSRKHCRFYPFDGELWISDLQSANGTSVNFERLDNHARSLHIGDVISVGNATLSVVHPLHVNHSNEPLPSSPTIPPHVSSTPRPSVSTFLPPSNSSTRNSIPNAAPPSRHFPTFQRFKSAPFCIKFASVFIALHVLLDIFFSSLYHERTSLFAYFTAWLLYKILMAKNYARITLLVIRFLPIPFTLFHIHDPQFLAYFYSCLLTIVFSLLYLVPLFSPRAHLWFRQSSSTNP